MSSGVPLFHSCRQTPAQVHHRLGGVDCLHDICPGGGFQPELLGDPRDLRGGEHQPAAKQHIFVPNHEAGNEDGGLQKGGQAEADHLAAPAVEAVHIPPGDGEQIQASHRDLDEQNAAALEIGKEDFDDRVSHEDQQEQGDEDAVTVEAAHSGPGHIADPFGVGGPGDPRGQAALQVDAEFIEFYRDGGKQADRQKPLDRAKRQVPHSGSPSALVLHCCFKHRHHQPDHIKGPSKVVEELHHRLHPDQLKELASHAVHHIEKLGKELHDLSIDPVENLAQHRIRHKIPYEQGCSPPSVHKNRHIAKLQCAWQFYIVEQIVGPSNGSAAPVV